MLATFPFQGRISAQKRNTTCAYFVISELIEGNGYEGRQTSKGELFVKVFGMSRDFEGAHIDFKMAASL